MDIDKYTRHLPMNVFVWMGSFICFITFGEKISMFLSSYLKSYRELRPSQQSQWHNRNCSTFHATIASVIGCYIILYDNALYEDTLWGDSATAEALLSFTCGYACADLLLVMLRMSPSTYDAYWGILMHHVIVIITLFSTVSYGAAVRVTVMRLLAEMSTPFVNLRWCLAASDQKQSKLYFYNGCMLLLTFFVSRIMLMPYCYIQFLAHHDANAMRKLGYLRGTLIGAAVVDTLNCFWFVKIIKGIMKYANVSSCIDDQHSLARSKEE